MTTEATMPELAHDYVCRHCQATGLTKAEQLRHGRVRARTGECPKDEMIEQPIAAEQEADGPALDEQISAYARELAGRQFIHQSTNWISDHGAERIARLVLEGETDLNAATRQVLPGFAGWVDEAAQ